MDANYLTVEADSTYHEVGGSTRREIGGYYRRMFNPSNGKYDVAVLWVCGNFDIPMDSAKYVMYLQ
jgi:hypothetical protein